MFLDVEPDTPMSEAYYSGWSDGLVAAGGEAMSTDKNMVVPAVKFQPCVYMKPSADPRSLRALISAMAAGAPCAGLWVTRQRVEHCDIFRPWDPAFVIPAGLPANVPVWMWQWVIDCDRIDYNIANPDLHDELLQRLILPERQAFVGESGKEVA